MGCGPSKPARLMEMAPPRSDSEPQKRVMDEHELEQHLGALAARIHQKKCNYEIFVVGGAINAMYLKSRHTTEDIDFFNPRLREGDLRFLQESATFIANRSRNRLPENWFNNRNIAWIPSAAVQEALVEESLRQDTVMFRAPGLTLYVAPWKWCIASKLQRMAGGGNISHDLADAVAYLHRYLEREGRRTVEMTEVQHWVASYHLRIATSKLEEILQRVNHEFHSLHGESPIRF